MSDTPMDDQLHDGDDTLGNDDGPADSGAGQGLPGEHDGGADGGAGGSPSDGQGGLAIVSDTDAYASTEPLPIEEQSPARTPDAVADSGDRDGVEGPADSGAGDAGVPGHSDDGADGDAEGPADSGAGDPGVPGHGDDGADGDAEGPADSGAGDPGTTDEHDGGADGGAGASS